MAGPTLDRTWPGWVTRDAEPPSNVAALEIAWEIGSERFNGQTNLRTTSSEGEFDEAGSKAMKSAWRMVKKEFPHLKNRR